MKKFVKAKRLAVVTESIRDLSNDQMTQVGGASVVGGNCSMPTFAPSCTAKYKCVQY